MQGFIHHSFAPQECTTKHSYIELFIEVSEPSQKSRCNVFLSCGYPFCPFLWFFPLNFGNVPPVWYLLFFIFFYLDWQVHNVLSLSRSNRHQFSQVFGDAGVYSPIIRIPREHAKHYTT